jgi:hypothetical protein
MGRALRFTLIGCGGLVALVVVIGVIGALIGGGTGTQPSSPPERAEQDEGVEGGGKDPEAKKPLQGERAKPADEGGQEEQAQQQQRADEGGGEVIFRVTGAPGVRFQGNVGNMDTQRSVQGTTPQDFPVKNVDTGAFSMDVVSGNAQKMGAGREKLTVQIVVDGEVVKESSTTANYGLAQVSWSPSE